MGSKKVYHCTFILLVILYSLFPGTSFAETVDPACHSIESILANPYICDGKIVEVEGKVINIKQKISQKGNPYTQFELMGVNSSVNVFLYGFTNVKQDEKVIVKGTYYLENKSNTGSYSNEIVTIPENISLSKEHIDYPLIFVLLVVGLLTIPLAIKYFTKTGKIEEIASKNDFEKFVLNLLPETKWQIIDWTKDLSHIIKRSVASDSNPDLIVKHIPTGKIIALECKYRSKFRELRKGPGITWAEEYKIKKYNEFQEKSNLSIYIIIGVGGKPQNPLQLYRVPLSKLKYQLVFEKYLEKFKRSPNEPFRINEYAALE